MTLPTISTSKRPRNVCERYQHFGAVMPADGGRAQLTPEVSARRRKAAKQATGRRAQEDVSDVQHRPAGDGPLLLLRRLSTDYCAAGASHRRASTATPRR